MRLSRLGCTLKTVIRAVQPGKSDEIRFPPGARTAQIVDSGNSESRHDESEENPIKSTDNANPSPGIDLAIVVAHEWPPWPSTYS
jgi:hypothetical protein